MTVSTLARHQLRATGLRSETRAAPEKPHDHWHTDISYLNLGGTFFYLCSVLGLRALALSDRWDIGVALTLAPMRKAVRKLAR